MEAEKIQKYLEGIRNQNTREATANGRIFMILQFYNFLVVKRYLKRSPSGMNIIFKRSACPQ